MTAQLRHSKDLDVAKDGFVAIGSLADAVRWDRRIAISVAQLVYVSARSDRLTVRYFNNKPYDIPP